MRKTLSLLVIAAAAAGLLSFTSAQAAGGIDMTVEPDAISIGALYNGTTVTVKGTIPAASEAVVRFLGAPCELHMKEKGKVFGLVWMNLDSLTFKGIPGVCVVSSAKDFCELTGRNAKGSAAEALRLEGLRRDAQIEAPSGAGNDDCFSELIKLKKGEGLYRELTGNVSYGPVADGNKAFQVEIPVPSRLSPGDYTVEVAAIKDGEIAASGRHKVSVRLAGAPAMLAGLAFGHGALYGILATVIALLSGLAIGMVFKSKGAH